MTCIYQVSIRHEWGWVSALRSLFTYCSVIYCSVTITPNLVFNHTHCCYYLKRFCKLTVLSWAALPGFSCVVTDSFWSLSQLLGDSDTWRSWASLHLCLWGLPHSVSLWGSGLPKCVSWERAPGGICTIFSISLDSTQHPFCCSLFIRSEPLRPACFTEWGFPPHLMMGGVSKDVRTCLNHHTRLSLLCLLIFMGPWGQSQKKPSRSLFSHSVNKMPPNTAAFSLRKP